MAKKMCLEGKLPRILNSREIKDLLQNVTEALRRDYESGRLSRYHVISTETMNFRHDY